MIKWVHCQGFAPRISCVFSPFRSRFLWQQDGRHPHRCPSYRKGFDEKDSELWWFFWWLWYGGFACWFLHVFSDVHVFTPNNFLTKYWPLAVQGKNEVQFFQLTTRNMRNCWWLWTLRDFVAHLNTGGAHQAKDFLAISFSVSDVQASGGCQICLWWKLIKTEGLIPGFLTASEVLSLLPSRDTSNSHIWIFATRIAWPHFWEEKLQILARLSLVS